MTHRRMQQVFATLWIVIIAALGSPGPANGQSLDNKGTDFIFGFLPNALTEITVELHLASDVDVDVTVQYPVNAPTFTTTVGVIPGTITIVSLPVSAALGWTAGASGNNAIRAFADDEFVCYMINRGLASSDAALALPIDTMNTEYLAYGHTGSTLHGEDRGEFLVVAAFDQTEVSISPAVSLLNVSASPIVVTLDRGEGFLAQSMAASGPAADITGSIITSTKPVGLTTGNRCTNVPSDVGACDHIFEIAQPTQSWGMEALVAGLPNRPGGSVYRVIASEDGTSVTLDDAPIGTIDRGQFIEISALAGNHVFVGDKPIYVVQLMTGVNSPGAILGDPALGNIVPAEQYLSSYTFSTIGGAQFSQNFVTIIAHDEDVGSLLLDDVPIPAATFTSIGTTGFAAAVLALVEGVHTTRSDRPHGIWVEGYDFADSYLYPGGAFFQFINPKGDPYPPLCEFTVDSSGLVGSGTATDDRSSEDVNGNGILDPGEDLNDNGTIDEDTGIFFLQLVDGATNLILTTDPFVPGDPSVGFTVTIDDPLFPGSGEVRATDGRGNTCTVAVELGSACGDGVTNPGEECDDGNLVACDGCSPACVIEVGFACGDGILNEACGQECDDGGTDPCDGCSPTCTIEFCGDGITCAPEECDDGNTDGGDLCDTGGVNPNTAGNCTWTFCNDGALQNPNGQGTGGTTGTGDEQCDFLGDICSDNCVVRFCGDGVLDLDLGEQCDDGNMDSGDCCSSTCVLEGIDGCVNCPEVFIDPIECTQDDPCDVLDPEDECPPEATINHDEVAVEIESTCGGDEMLISHARRGSYVSTTTSTAEVCDSDCHNECFENCIQIPVQECYSECILRCTNGVCIQWEQVCNIVGEQVFCDESCFTECQINFNEEMQESSFTRPCGLEIDDLFEIREANGSCTGPLVGSHAVHGLGVASINIPLPLTPGDYELCLSGEIVENFSVDDCGAACRILFDQNSFTLTQGVDTALLARIESFVAGGPYTLSLHRFDDDSHTVPLPLPPFLFAPATVEVQPDTVTAFSLTATNPQPVGAQNHWGNVILRADGATRCEAPFDVDVRLCEPPVILAEVVFIQDRRQINLYRVEFSVLDGCDAPSSTTAWIDYGCGRVFVEDGQLVRYSPSPGCKSRVVGEVIEIKSPSAILRISSEDQYGNQSTAEVPFPSRRP